MVEFLVVEIVFLFHVFCAGEGQRAVITVPWMVAFDIADIFCAVGVKHSSPFVFIIADSLSTPTQTLNHLVKCIDVIQ